MHEIKKMAYTGSYPCTKCENVQILQYTSGLVSERSQLSLADEYIAKRTQTSGRAGVILKFSRRNTKAVHLPPDLFELVLGCFNVQGIALADCLILGMAAGVWTMGCQWYSRPWSNRKSATHKPSSAIVRCKVELDNPPKDYVCTVNRFYIVCSQNGDQLYRILALVTPYDILECYLGIYTISVRHPKPLMVVPVSSLLHQVVIVPFANNIGDQDPHRCCIITASKGEEYRAAGS